MELIDTIEAIDNLLPQTQCGDCGHPGCRPYAEAIAKGEPINRCPPGGDKTIVALAAFLQRDILPLDGITKPKTVAFIREEECIGCTKCIDACPVDAILGAAKHMHTVIIDECTGCNLCVDPCPVDCIDMLPAISDQLDKPMHYKTRLLARNSRLQRIAEQREKLRASRKQKLESKTTETLKPKSKLDEVRDAIARAKAKKSALAPASSDRS
ncbi:MAG: electron transporter RnfB [Verrucomicrobiaceae bacterium]|nr:electron transporter RnfB [Verrucomicrobiaceae bacterium]